MMFMNIAVNVDRPHGLPGSYTGIESLAGITWGAIVSGSFNLPLSRQVPMKPINSTMNSNNSETLVNFMDQFIELKFG